MQGANIIDFALYNIDLLAVTTEWDEEKSESQVVTERLIVLLTGGHDPGNFSHAFEDSS